MEFEYFDCVEAILQKVRFSEAANMCAGVDLLEKCVMDHGSIYIFGASHAGILSQEMFYRAGGLMPINPIFGKEVSVEASPITLTSDMERLVGYGTALASTVQTFRLVMCLSRIRYQGVIPSLSRLPRLQRCRGQVSSP